MACMFSLDHENMILHEVVDLTGAPATTAVFSASMCSTVRVDLVFTDATDAAAVSDVNEIVLLQGDLADGSDQTAVVPTFTAVPQVAGSTGPNHYQSFEFCPCKPYHSITFPNVGLGDAHVIVRGMHCRTTPPQKETPDGFLANKLVCTCLEE